METAVIVHGGFKKEVYDELKISPSNMHWIPWMQKEFLQAGVLAQTPEMPTPYEPKYEEWSRVLEQYPINEDTTLIGHSFGGGFLVRWLSEHKVSINKLVLAAPWVNPHQEYESEFFKFEIDARLAERTAGLKIIYSTDDKPGIIASVAYLKETLIGAEVTELTGLGHLTFKEMRRHEFPELRALVLD